MTGLMRVVPKTKCCLAGLMLAVALAGCGEGEKPKTPAAAEQAKPAVAEKPDAKADAPDPKVLAVLAKADAADGKTDQVVSKCVTCGLAMDGKAEHAATVGSYKVHLCSADCKGSFDKDPAHALLALKIP